MPDTVRELIGVYAADGTPLGEARYWIGARLGRTHCALCEITHGLFTERADWRRCRDQLEVGFRAWLNRRLRVMQSQGRCRGSRCPSGGRT
jgi:hypothetical protein